MIKYRNDIDGLRALAVIGVLAFHAGIPYISGGYAGVDVFFVISGYLITTLLLSEIQSTNRINFFAFYARRFRRLVPAMITVVIFVAIIGGVLFSPVERELLAGDMLAAVFYVANIYFAYQATDYLAGDRDVSPLLHFWSLGVEEQFYVFWPLLLILIYSLCVKLYSNQQDIEKYKRWSLIVFLLLALFSFVLSYRFSHTDQPIAFFSLYTRSWEFCVGAILAFVSKERIGLIERYRNVLVFLGLSLIVFSYFYLNKSTLFPGIAVLLPVSGAFFILSAGLCQKKTKDTFFIRILNSKVVGAIGRSSYSLYLWHWPFVVYAERIWGDSGWEYKVLAVLASIIPAVVAYKVIERPIHKGTLISEGLSKGIWIGVSGIVIGGLSSIILMFGHKVSIDYKVQSRDELVARVDNLKSDIPAVYKNKCHLSFVDVKSEECNFNKVAGSNVEVVLLGDSHAAQWFSPLLETSIKKGWNFYSYTKSGCSVAQVTRWHWKYKRVYTECDEWRKSILDRLTKTTKLRRYIIISGASGGASLIDPVTHEKVKKNQIKETWHQGWKKTLERLRAFSGNNIVLIVDTPRVPHNMAVCLSKNIDAPELCDFDVGNVGFYERRLSEEYSWLGYIDMTKYICGKGKVCKAVNNGLPTYKDKHHISDTYSKTMASDLELELKIIVR